MKVKTIEEAWALALNIFPYEYEQDIESSEKAGYPVYRSINDNHKMNYISALCDRLEVNLETGESINIWIISDDIEDIKGIEVLLIPDTGMHKLYSDFSNFINDYRFWFSSGKPSSDEDLFNEIVKSLLSINVHDLSISIRRNGLNIYFTLKKW